VSRGRFASAAVSDDEAPRGSSAGSDERRLQILRAAADVICERGFDDTRVAQVANRAGVSGGTIIYHFRTLDQLLVEALKHAEELFYASAEGIVAGGTSPQDRLRRLVEWMFSPDHDNRQLWSLWIDTWSQATRHEEVATTRAAQDQRWRTMIARIVGELPITRRDIERFAVGFAAILDGLMIQMALDDPNVDAELARELAMSYASAALGW